VFPLLPNLCKTAGLAIKEAIFKKEQKIISCMKLQKIVTIQQKEDNKGRGFPAAYRFIIMTRSLPFHA
jgi:hypothetical protein